MGYCFMVNGWPMKKKPKPSDLKAIKRRTSGERAGTKPDQAGRVKRGKAAREIAGSRRARRSETDDTPAAVATRQGAVANRRTGSLGGYGDFLLDIPNRRGFERELNRSIAYIKRYHASGALIVLDVDRLKPINDAYGHAAGDEVLKAIVAVLLRHVRSSDVIGRLGGDEFALLLWNLSETDARAKAASLEEAVDGLSFVFRGRRISAGASAGVAILGTHAEAGKALEEADSAMYVRKAQRRHEG